METLRKLGMFRENNGKLSNIRVQSFLVLLVTLLVIAYQVKNGSTDLVYTSMLLGFAFFPKMMQKIAENSSKKKAE